MIGIRSLDKYFGKVHALRKISTTIRKGRVTAIIGPNGSGKTTLIKSILGLTTPDSGEIVVGGVTLNGHCQYRTQIGYMPQIASFPNNLTIAEVIQMLKSLRGNSCRHDERLIEIFGLDNQMDKSVRALSGGTKQKVSAVIAFLFYPKILIFDEPTAGLDPLSSRILKQEILKKKEEGCTIIITTHILSELESLADDILFINDGTIRFDGSVEELKKRSGACFIEDAIANVMEGERV